MIATSLLIAACTVSAQSTFDASKYQFNYAVRSSMKLYWSIVPVPSSPSSSSPLVGSRRNLSFAIEYGTTSGWLGFGLAEPAAGGMSGADMMIAMVSADGSLIVQDRYAVAQSQPLMDGDAPTTPSDWVGVAAWRTASTTIVEATRSLAVVSNMTYDRVIVEDGRPTRLIFAFGSTSEFDYHGANRATAAINLFNSSDSRLESLLARSDTVSEKWLRNNYTVPSQVTTYVKNLCFQPPSSTGGAPYLVAIRSVLQAGNEPYVHHIAVKAYARSDCGGQSQDIYAAGSATSAFVFPDDVGLDLTSAGSYNFETHYDNPTLRKDIVDSSGVEIFYTRTARKLPAGLLQLGDPFVLMSGGPAVGITSYGFDCPSGCTKKWSTSITVFATLHHMHRTGALMQTQYYRNGLAVNTTTTEYYSFQMQDQQFFTPFVVQPGDSITTTCTYQRAQGSPSVNFGIASDEEMCIDFVYYYPRQQVTEGTYCGNAVCGFFSGVVEGAALPRSFGPSIKAVEKPLTTTASPTTTASTSTKSSPAANHYPSWLVPMVILTLFALPLDYWW